MIRVSTTFNGVYADPRGLARISRDLANKVAEIHANQFKIALVRSKAIASGSTLQSVRVENTLDSPSRGQYIRRVQAKRSWENINFGRRPGLKMPVRFVGTSPTGGKMFEPVPEMLVWFQTLGIPRSAWFPILRKIARDGIKPRLIQNKMMREARPIYLKHATNVADELSKTMFTKSK